MMNSIYKYIELENGNILLEKITLDFSKYNLEYTNDNIICKKKEYIKLNSLSQLKKYNFKKSNIKSCTINNEEFQKLKYKSILDKIYNIIGNGTIIIKNTSLNILTIEKITDGFYYMDNLGISIQGAESNKCLYEIINQCIKNEIDLDISIELNDKNGVHINI